ncbi:MAG TPA: hypothetical protein VGR27_12885 [Longimicrobiaceae bacterium]|nr:hypothetical protein [Longimicrobiaceae bacterium]
MPDLPALTEQELAQIEETIHSSAQEISPVRETRLGPAATLLLAEVRRLKQAVEEEREACIAIAEDALRHLGHGHGMTGQQAIGQIIEAIRRRGQEG